MARMPRIVVPHVPHHVTQRRNRRMRTFFSVDDYEAYISYVRESTEQTGTEVWAYCLMPNHVHLILVPADKDGLRGTFAEAHRRYTRRVNFREGTRRCYALTVPAIRRKAGAPSPPRDSTP